MNTLSELLSTGALSFVLIVLAEFGDKSQLVCMTLAARHRPWPILWGATTAFALLNLLAVLFGTAVAAWIPTLWLGLAVVVLFTLFGIQALRFQDGEEEQAVRQPDGRSLFLTAAAMIFIAEFGDKTQLAVAGLGTSFAGLAVWCGATLALLTTTALGVWVGQRLLKQIPLQRVHQISGLLFLGLAALTLYQLL